jgi:hypothetical protein
MNRLSQRTLVRMMEVMERMGRAVTATPRRGHLGDFASAEKRPWSRLLLENEFPPWLVSKAERMYDFAWDRILLDLHDGKFVDPSEALSTGEGAVLNLLSPKATGEVFLERLAAFLADRPEGESVLRSLELDGLCVNMAKLELIPLEGPVSQQEEEDRLTHLVRAAGLPRETTILKHITDAGNLYSASMDHSALGESRTFLQALIDDISVETNAHGRHTRGLPGGTKNRIEYLGQVGFLTQDEQAALDSAWGLLSAGAHPGVPSREAARIGMILAIEFAQILLLKFQNWKANQYGGFA